jgi:hypothetical protein
MKELSSNTGITYMFMFCIISTMEQPEAGGASQKMLLQSSGMKILYAKQATSKKQTYF